MADTVLRMVRGETKIVTGTIEQDGAALDITGASIAFSVKWAYTDAANIFQLTVGSGITVNSAPAGTVTITIAASNTSTLPLSTVNLKYDIQLTEAGGNVYVVARGDLVVEPNVS